MALRAFSCNPSLGGFGSENVAASAGRRRHRQEAGQEHQDPIGTSSGDTRRSIQSAKRKGSNAAMKANHAHDYDCGGGGGDAFAQILKELVDNAVDACCAATSTSSEASCRTTTTDDDDDGGHGGKRTSRSMDLKRVRVVIEPVVTSSGRADEEIDEGNAAATCTTTGTKKELLRVSVNDNGVGMSSIEDCVEAFRTSKRSNGTLPSSNSQGNIGTGSTSGSIGVGGSDSAPRDNDTESQAQPSGESRTAGRYGIGLTLCLLHSQRLCPNSVASITSATADATQWTRASYVVDTEGDRVRCLKKEMLDKKRAGESGTVVSLLVPGGSEAAAVWPRLAEYFARFQLSDMPCSLEVKAPTLSTIPLYIRPIFEMKQRKKRLEKNYSTTRKGREQIHQNEEDESDENKAITAAEIQDTGTSRDGCIDGNKDRNALESDDDEWDDGLTVDDVGSEQRYVSSQDARGSAEESDDGQKQIDNGQSPLATSKKNDSEDNARKDIQRPTNWENSEDDRRDFIQRAASSYLNRHIELRNVAHSVNPIRRREETQTGDMPMLEVDMVVYGRAPPNNDHAYTDGEESAASSNIGDEFDGILDGKNNDDESGEAGKLILIRMVNRIPLLDGAEASSCGLVRGISKKKSTWNSYGLEVSPLIEDSVPCVLGDESNAQSHHNEIEACIPTYHLKDSAQVAPFFRSNTHALYESDSDGNGELDSDKEDGSDCSYVSSGDEEKVKYASKKRKRKKRAKLLPAGIRIGNLLVIAQIHASPSALPLPTLSKGRLPMNDADIDDALEIGLSSCLRSLQRSNPDLLLTANQLKRTERDVRYLPAIAASLASIIKTSSNSEFRGEVYGKVMSWRQGQSGSDTKKNDTKTSENTDDDNASTSSKSSIGSEHLLNESMDRLGALQLTGLIEDKIRYCISEENKQRKKDEERERKLEARRKEKARKEKAKEKRKQKQKRSKMSKISGKRKNAKIDSGGVRDESDSGIDLDDLLLEGESEEEEMEDSEDSNDSSVLARRERARRIIDLAFIGSDDESSSCSNSTNSAREGKYRGKMEPNESDGCEMEGEDDDNGEESDGDRHAEESDFSEDETILRPPEDAKNRPMMTREKEVEEKKDDDDGFDDGFDYGDDDEDWL